MTYDISTVDVEGTRRLARVAATCERYGQRVQYSVFECRLDAILLQRLVSDLHAQIHPARDSVRIYRLGVSFDAARLSLGREGHDWDRPLVF